MLFILRCSVLFFSCILNIIMMENNFFIIGGYILALLIVIPLCIAGGVVAQWIINNKE